MKDNKSIKDLEAEELKITSPRTAEHPGPSTFPPEDCCSSDKGPRNNNDDHDHGVSYIPTVLSFILLLSGILLTYLEIPWFKGVVKFTWFAAAYLPVGGKVLVQAGRNMAKGDVFNEFFLMGIATIGAFYIGEYGEGVAVMLFYVIGEHFQESAVHRSRKSIKDLIDNRPDSANVFRNGNYHQVHPSTVRIGETIRLKAGEKVPLDGEMLGDRAFFKTDALTGESKPQSIQKGEKVLAGMVNQEKVVEIRTNAAYEDSALSKVLKLVEQAGTRKAKTQQFITKFAKIYTPAVVFLALGLIIIPFFMVDGYDFEQWLYRALVFLVISCPCALVISIPLGYFGGIGAASKNGILFKGSNFLDLITQVDTIVLDKTGTLTEGVFKVQQIEASKGSEIDPDKLISLTAALESQSSHPIAKAITDHAGKAPRPLHVSDVEEISGFGIKGKVEGMDMLAGNLGLLQKSHIPYPSGLDQTRDTLVAVAIAGIYAGHITIADTIKEDAAQTVKKLHQLGIKEIMMLSGDRISVVESVAEKLSIDQAYGELLPQDKVDKVERLKQQGRTVAFVGDGINDAPVIALADVGIAMGALGSDAAIETADVVIQNDQPSKIVTAINIGKKTRQGVWQNIGMAFGVKALVLTLGAFGIASLWEAVFADVGVALLAIFNAMRIQRMGFK